VCFLYNLQILQRGSNLIKNKLGPGRLVHALFVYVILSPGRLVHALFVYVM